MDKVDKIFDAFAVNNLFKNKTVLQSHYSPQIISHRDEQIQTIASILAPSLRGERTSNLFVYGRTGSGKTLSIHHVCNKLTDKLEEAGKNYLKLVYVNCKLRKIADTEYRILAEIIHELGESVPATGLPTDQVYNKFVNIIDRKKQNVIIVLDEIDQAVKKISDGFIYNLTRLNSEFKNAQISIIGISNDASFMDYLDPRVRSSLGEEEIVFPSYNALQLQDILRERAEKAFIEGTLEEGVVEKCAAFAAKEHGDARRALDLLRVAAELAEREQGKKITLANIDAANKKIEKDSMLELIEGQPKQYLLVLNSILELEDNEERRKAREEIFTGDVYNKYQEICGKTKNETLTQRRVSDIIQDFDMMGVINARVISKGRQGRTREIKSMLSDIIKEKTKEIIQKAVF